MSFTFSSHGPGFTSGKPPSGMFVSLPGKHAAGAGQAKLRSSSSGKKHGFVASTLAIHHDLCAACRKNKNAPGGALCESCFTAWRTGNRQYCPSCGMKLDGVYKPVCKDCFEQWEHACESTIVLCSRNYDPNDPDIRRRSVAVPHKKTSDDIQVDESTLWTVEDQSNLPTGEEDKCSICLTEFAEDRASQNYADDPVVKLKVCGHLFHRGCLLPILKEFKTGLRCPECQTVSGILTGKQPLDCSVIVMLRDMQLPGYEQYKTIVVRYDNPDGVQGPEHPNPGHRYKGESRFGLFPASEEGLKVVQLILLAWEHRLIFNIGDSLTTGQKDVVIWNGIHHKTSVDGGPTAHGYPDPTYLNRVAMELASFGVTEDKLPDPHI